MPKKIQINSSKRKYFPWKFETFQPLINIMWWLPLWAQSKKKESSHGAHPTPKPKHTSWTVRQLIMFSNTKFFVFSHVMFQLWAIDGQVWDSNPGKDMLTSVEIWTWWNYKSADCKYLIRRTVLSIWVLLVVGSFGTEPHLETQTKGKLGQERFRLPPHLFLSPCFFLFPDFPRKVEPWSELNAIDVG